MYLSKGMIFFLPDVLINVIMGIFYYVCSIIEI